MFATSKAALNYLHNRSPKDMLQMCNFWIAQGPWFQKYLGSREIKKHMLQRHFVNFQRKIRNRTENWQLINIIWTHLNPQQKKRQPRKISQRRISQTKRSDNQAVKSRPQDTQWYLQSYWGKDKEPSQNRLNNAQRL